jgi:hypothetical protein
VHAILTVSHKELSEAELRAKLSDQFRPNDPAALSASTTVPPDAADLITYACRVPGLILICFRVSATKTQLTVEPQADTIWTATQSAWSDLAHALKRSSPKLVLARVIETSSDVTISAAKSRRERARDLLGFAQLIAVAIAGVLLVVFRASDAPSQIAAWLAGVVALFQLNGDALETEVVSRVANLPGLSANHLSESAGRAITWEPDLAIESDDGSTVMVVETKSGVGPLHFSAVTQLMKFAENADQRFPQADDIKYVILTDQEVPESIAELAGSRGIQVTDSPQTLEQFLREQRAASAKAPDRRSRRTTSTKTSASKLSAKKSATKQPAKKTGTERLASSRGTAPAAASRQAASKSTPAKRAAVNRAATKTGSAKRGAAKRATTKVGTAKPRQIVKKSA